MRSVLACRPNSGQTGKDLFFMQSKLSNEKDMILCVCLLVCSFVWGEYGGMT